jgi:hypothetical protein
MILYVYEVKQGNFYGWNKLEAEDYKRNMRVVRRVLEALTANVPEFADWEETGDWKASFLPGIAWPAIMVFPRNPHDVGWLVSPVAVTWSVDSGQYNAVVFKPRGAYEWVDKP